MTKPAISFGAPNSSVAVRIVVGNVALDDEVEKAVTISVRQPR